MVMLGPMFDYLTGKHGHILQAISAAVYTAACVSGSIFAHYWALKTEKGKDAVGFNKKYAQIPIEEWEELQQRVTAYIVDAARKDEQIKIALSGLPTAEQFARVRSLAETAHDIALGALPDSGIVAQKVGSLTVVTGLKS